MTRIARICAKCEERFIPSGKTDKLCESCWENAIKKRGSGIRKTRGKTKRYSINYLKVYKK